CAQGRRAIDVRAVALQDPSLHHRGASFARSASARPAAGGRAAGRGRRDDRCPPLPSRAADLRAPGAGLPQRGHRPGARNVAGDGTEPAGSSLPEDRCVDAVGAGGAGDLADPGAGGGGCAMTALQAEAFVAQEPTDPSELVPELTRLALASACKAEFRGRALALLSRALPFDRAVWEEVPPFGDFRVVYPGVSWIGGRDGESRAPACVVAETGQDVDEGAEAVAFPGEEQRASADQGRAVLRLDLERFGRTRAVLTVERGGEA